MNRRPLFVVLVFIILGGISLFMIARPSKEITRKPADNSSQLLPVQSITIDLKGKTPNQVHAEVDSLLEILDRH